MATTKVILREKIEGLGSEADVVTVKRGYASNFLVPAGKAFEATRGNLRQIEQLKAVRAQREAEELNEAQRIATKLKKLRIKLELTTGQGGKAFGSITSKDIAEAIADQGKGLEIDRHNLGLDKPIKSTGDFDIPVKVHPDVDASVHVQVKAKADEAEGEGEEDS